MITDLAPTMSSWARRTATAIEPVTQAVRLVTEGARFIATNPDPGGPGEGGFVPACGAMAALIEPATGVAPYFVGKPNPLMMRTALSYLAEHSENTVMVGDRMDTDIVGGVESGLETVLVLTGVTSREDVARFPFQPTRVLESVAEILAYPPPALARLGHPARTCAPLGGPHALVGTAATAPITARPSGRPQERSADPT